MPARMRVATFNVHHCEGLDGRVDIGRIAEVVRATEADVIGLQELDRHLPRSGSVDQPAALAEATGMNVVFHATLARTKGDYGIAIAAREPLEVHFERLPQLGEEEPRGMLIATYRGVTVIVTHLSRDRSARLAQIAVLATAASARSPVLVLGDLNAEPNALEPFEAAGFGICGPAPTMPARRPRRQIDHILVGPGLTLRGFRTIATDASDHRPLVAEIELRKGEIPDSTKRHG